MLEITLGLYDAKGATANTELMGLPIHESLMQRAALRALNKTGRWLRAQLSKDTSQTLGIAVRAVRQSITLVPAKRRSLQVMIGLEAKSSRIRAKDLGTATPTSRGVRVGRTQFDRAFLARMPTGRDGIFERRGRARLPIREVAIVLTGALREHMHALEDGAIELRLRRIFVQEYRFLLRTARREFRQ